MQPYLKYKEFMCQRYGEALYRIPVDLGYGCPNRGSDGRGGCLFCAENGGRAQQITGITGLPEQIEAAAGFARRRYGARKYMLYIQAYTGTFADSERFAVQIRELLAVQEFAAVSIGTRPDCLPQGVVDFLAELNRRVEVWVELGVQSTHDASLTRLRRGHDWSCSRAAVLRLAAAGLKVAPHLILGLPGEGRAEWCQSAARIAELPVAGVKIHNLHVIAGSALADEFEHAPFQLLNEHQYAEGVIEVLRRLPPDIPVIRLTTDTPDAQLIAPRWSMTKGEFSKFLADRMGFQGVTQGDLYRGGAQLVRAAEHGFDPLPTDDGSVTFWNPAFKEHYHSRLGAVSEARSKFIEPAELAARLGQGDLRLLDICFGMGYNTLAACELAESAQAGVLSVTALEIDIHVIRAAAAAVSTPAGSILDWRAVVGALAVNGSWRGKFSSIRLLHGDARDKLDAAAAAAGSFDIIFLDAFSTQRNAELWTLDFFSRIRAYTGARGVLLTYCAALPVRSALMQAGFYVGETLPAGRLRGGTIAAVCAADICMPVPDEELQLIQGSNRALPYRDPQQLWSSRQILCEREARRRSGSDRNRPEPQDPALR